MPWQAYLSKAGGEPDRIRKQGDSVHRAASSLDAEVSKTSSRPSDQIGTKYVTVGTSGFRGYLADILVCTKDF